MARHDEVPRSRGSLSMRTFTSEEKHGAGLFCNGVLSGARTRQALAEGATLGLNSGVRPESYNLGWRVESDDQNQVKLVFLGTRLTVYVVLFIARRQCTWGNARGVGLRDCEVRHSKLAVLETISSPPDHALPPWQCRQGSSKTRLCLTLI